jgi:hypothetical protein
MNVINQSVIGAKEGVVVAVSKLVGSDITDGGWKRLQKHQ